MKFERFILGVCVLAVCSTPLLAETAVPYLGVQLSQQPLPGLLAKHLQLDAGRGVLVQNILVDSPADKAGLDKDDIIVQFNGEAVTDYQQLTSLIQACRIGRTVTLGVIQSGTLKDIDVELEAKRPDSQWSGWKYAPQLESSHVWRPGRIFRFDPEDFNAGIPEMPNHDDIFDVLKNFSAARMYQYQHGSGSDRFTVTIQGSPEKEDTTVTVKAGHDEHKATIGTVDQIPEEFRQAVLDDIEKSKNYTIELKPHQIQPPDFDNFKPYESWKERSGDVNADLRQKMQQMQQQLNDLQKEWNEKFEQLEKKLTRSSREIQA